MRPGCGGARAARHLPAGAPRPARAPCAAAPAHMHVCNSCMHACMHACMHSWADSPHPMHPRHACHAQQPLHACTHTHACAGGCTHACMFACMSRAVISCKRHGRLCEVMLSTATCCTCMAPRSAWGLTRASHPACPVMRLPSGADATLTRGCMHGPRSARVVLPPQAARRQTAGTPPQTQPPPAAPGRTAPRRMPQSRPQTRRPATLPPRPNEAPPRPSAPGLRKHPSTLITRKRCSFDRHHAQVLHAILAAFQAPASLHIFNQLLPAWDFSLTCGMHAHWLR
jgi:hypothetical protein